MTNTEWLHDRITAGIGPVGTFPEAAMRASADVFYGTNGILWDMIRHAYPRKLMGAARYEQVGADGLSYDAKAKYGAAKTYAERAITKWREYQATGNKEMLIDAWNYAMLEWYHETHPEAHFNSTERHL